MKKIKSNIGWLIDKSKYSREDLMERYKKSRNTISNWCTGKSYPSAPEMYDLAALFGVYVDELYSVEDDEEKDPLLKHIEVLELSRRVELILMRNGINTVSGLSLVDLTRLRGLGPNGIKEIEEKLSFYRRN
ncbi:MULTISPECIES: helix-turn-helix domain-containing protein [Bacillaceae]|uniref:helix-turn-helix domain-containing protein n=1 Tax=Bacillaceae TaxID=186817 RepID=UPI001408E5CF|nr:MULTISPECIES: helix-turn-helix domain-containing protein [Bacillaceae]